MYQSNWSHNSANVDAVMSFIDANGTQTPANNPTPFSGGTGTPDVAYTGGGNGKYLVVWRNNTLSNANNSIGGRIMNSDGTFATGGFTIAEATGRQLRPVVGFDGDTFVVVWDDQRNQGAFFDMRTDIYAARVTTAGVVLDPAGIPIIRGANAEATAAILSSDGASLIASARFVPTQNLDSYRVGITRLGDLPPACAADFNNDGVTNSQDYFDFMTAFFAGAPEADFNADGSVNSQDFFDFVSGFFVGC